MAGTVSALDLQKYAAVMRDQSLKLARTANDRTFANGDARNSFHNAASNAILLHCIAIGMYHASRSYKFTGRGRDATVVDVIDLMSNGELQEYFFSKLRARLFLEIWFAFEDWLRVLYRGVVPKDVQTADNENELQKFVNPPKRVSLPITTVSSRVLDAAVDRKARGARKQLTRSRAVIEFWSASRNAMCHANTFYTGPTRALKLGKRALRLVDGTPTDFHSFEQMPALIDSLVEVANFIRSGITPVRIKRISSPTWLLESARIVTL